MKKYQMTIVILMIFVGCQTQTKTKDSHDIIAEKIETELATNVRNDTIFLNFRFGMDRNEVSEHIRDLMNEGKLSVNRQNYEYVFDFGENKVPRKAIANFNIEYFGDRLYKLILFVTSDEIISTPGLIQLHLGSVFLEKYGNFIRRQSIIDDKEAFVWIDGNRKIEVIEGINDARVFYTDLVAMKEKDKLDKLISDESKEKILNDI